MLALAAHALFATRILMVADHPEWRQARDGFLREQAPRSRVITPPRHRSLEFRVLEFRVHGTRAMKRIALDLQGCI